MSKLELAQQAVRYLAGVCDGACTRDGQGFNGVDSGFGKSLAQQESWSEKQAKSAVKMLKTYKGQLERAGFDVEMLFNEAPLEIPKRTTKPKEKRTAIIEKGKIKIQFPFDREVLDKIRDIPGRRFHDNSFPKYWTAPISYDAVKILVENKFEIDPELIAILREAGQAEETPIVEAVKISNIPGLKRTLFPYQMEGVSYIESKQGNALIGDEMGLGKTIQALAWLQLHPEKRPAIILCPAHLKLNWAKEIQMTLSDNLNTQILQGSKPYPITGEIVIINYDILKNWVEELQKIKANVLIFDEAHYIKSNSALRTKATKKLAKEIPHRIALTGTPIVNRPIEGFNIAQVINKTVFPNFMSYARRYCNAHHNGFGWDFSGSANKKELHRKLTETIMIRRKKADVLPDLPSKLYSYIPMEINNTSEYKRAEADFIAFLTETKGKKAAEKASQAEHLVRIEALKQLAVQGKIKQAVQWIRDFLDNNGNKLVVFGVHKTVVDALMKEFTTEAVKVDGSVSAAKRDEAVVAFQEDPNVKLFVGNIQAAGTGLTLTAASAVAFLEFDWVVGNHMQAEDRCHRIGQKDTVNIYYLIAAGSIEEKLVSLLAEKTKVIRTILDGEKAENINIFDELLESIGK